MRFSLGVFTERKQTGAFIEKVIGWDHAGIPSSLPLSRGRGRGHGYCGFSITLKCRVKLRSGTGWIPIIGNRGSHHRSRARCARARLCGSKMARDFANSSGKHPVRSVAEKNGMKGGKENYFSRFPTLVYAMSAKRGWQTLTLHELARQCPIRLRGRSARSVFENRFPQARRLLNRTLLGS